MSRLVVAAAIVDDLELPRLLLAARRSAPPQLAGQWEFPGGKVESDERPEEALRRELAEELGIEVELGPELPGPIDGGRGSHGGEIGPAWPLGPAGSDGRPLVLRIWLARITAGTPRALEDHDRLTWLGPGAWRNVSWVEADLAIVEALIESVVKRHRSGWC